MRYLKSIGGTGRTRVLLSLIRLHSTFGRATVRAIAADVGISVGTAHWHLQHLADEGLIAWDPGKRGTLRPLVERVA